MGITSLLAALALSACAAPAVPSAQALLESVLDFPTAAYSGQMTVISYSGRQARAHEVRVAYAPENRYRWEFLSPSGAVERVVVSDGKLEETRLFGPKTRVFVGDPVGSAPRELEGSEERLLLEKNYTVDAADGGELVGRRVRLLRISPKEPGKPRQELWIDAETGIVLQSRRFHPNGSRAAVSRFHRFSVGSPVEPGDFSLSSAAAAAPHGLGPTAEASTSALRGLPPVLAQGPDLPGGFSFDSADTMRIRGRAVSHLRWTDGLVSLSLFVSDRPARPSGDAPLRGAAVRALDADPGSGRVLAWKSKGRHYTLIGDLSPALLEAIRARLGTL